MHRAFFRAFCPSTSSPREVSPRFAVSFLLSAASCSDWHVEVLRLRRAAHHLTPSLLLLVLSGSNCAITIPLRQGTTWIIWYGCRRGGQVGANEFYDFLCVVRSGCQSINGECTTPPSVWLLLRSITHASVCVWLILHTSALRRASAFRVPSWPVPRRHLSCASRDSRGEDHRDSHELELLTHSIR